VPTGSPRGLSSVAHVIVGSVAGMRVLVVEDEPKMADLIKRGLVGQGHAVDVAANGEDALWSASEIAYDVIVLDAMIPAPDGFQVCRTMREREIWTPVLMLTARDGIDDRVTGLDAGADDYLTKPFAFSELFARLRALGRRTPTARPPLLRVGDLVLDPAQRSVKRGDTLIELSPTEYSLTEYLMRHVGQARTRAQIVENVWDFAFDANSNVVDVYIRYLREKLDRPFDVETIVTIRGVGYMLADPAAPA
jgi:two-component system, OmpR family, response regulator